LTRLGLFVVALIENSLRLYTSNQATNRKTNPPTLHHDPIQSTNPKPQCRVYTKKTGHKPDFSEPVVLTSDRGGTTVEAMCKQIHNTMVREFKYALVWGVSAKHYPQRVGLSHQLADEDVIQVWGCLVGGAVLDLGLVLVLMGEGREGRQERVKAAILERLLFFWVCCDRQPHTPSLTHLPPSPTLHPGGQEEGAGH